MQGLTTGQLTTLHGTLYGSYSNTPGEKSTRSLPTICIWYINIRGVSQRCGIIEYCSGNKYIKIFFVYYIAYNISYIYRICASHTHAIGIFTRSSHVKEQQTNKGTKPLWNVTLINGMYYHTSITSFYYCYSLYYSFN